VTHCERASRYTSTPDSPMTRMVMDYEGQVISLSLKERLGYICQPLTAVSCYTNGDEMTSFCIRHCRRHLVRQVYCSIITPFNSYARPLYQWLIYRGGESAPVPFWRRTDAVTHGHVS